MAEMQPMRCPECGRAIHEPITPLEAITCECYGAVRRNYERLLGQPFGRETV